MSSAIDATKPVAGTPTTSSVRSNFVFTEDELNELMRITEDSVTAAGTADALTANFIHDVVLAEGVLVCIKAATANTSTTPTLDADGTGAATITKNAGDALAAGDIAGAGHYCLFKYNASATEWALLNPKSSTDAATLGGVTAANYARTDTPETFTDTVDIGATLTIDDLAGDPKPAGFNVADIATHNAAYTLVLSDAGKMIYHSETTARAWTVPPNASVAFPVGTVINLLNNSTGNITITRGSGVVVRWFEGDGTAAVNGNHVLDGGSVATITKLASDTWGLWGNGIS